MPAERSSCGARWVIDDPGAAARRTCVMTMGARVQSGRPLVAVRQPCALKALSRAR